MVHRDDVVKHSHRLRRLGALALATAAIALIGPGEAVADYRSTVLADNPASYFRLDETGNATVMVNQVSGGANGTHILEPFQGSPGALVHETPNLSIGYTTADADRSTFPAGSAYSAFSLEFWVFTAMAFPPSVTQWYNGAGLVDGEVSGENNDAGTALIRDGLVGFGMGNPDLTIASTTDVADNEWHHVVATRDAGAMKLYVDGALEAQTAAGPTGARSNAQFTVGDLDTLNGPFTGGLDEVAFYRSALAPADVMEHYTVATERQVTVLVGLDGGAGDGVVTSDDSRIVCPNTCGANYPEDTVIDFTAAASPGSRFSGYDGADCSVFSATECRVITDDPTGVEFFSAIFHLEGETLGVGLSGTVENRAAALEGALDNIVDPKNKNGIKFEPSYSLVLDALDYGDSGGAVATLIPNNQVGLIGSDGGSLTPNAPAASSLIGSDGGTLIGSDGGTLIGSDGATLIGSDGGTRQRAAGCDPPGGGGKLFVLGRYSKALTVLGNTDVTFTLTNKGKQIIETFAKMNLKRADQKKKPKPFPATFIEAIQPSDELGTGATYDNMCIKK